MKMVYPPSIMTGILLMSGRENTSLNCQKAYANLETVEVVNKKLCDAKHFNTLGASARIHCTLKSHNSRYYCATLQLHKSPADCAIQLFKPSKDATSLLVLHLKNCKVVF